MPWVQKRTDKRRAGRSAQVGEPVSLNDLPSSTSVFRTPSANVDLVRQRTAISRETDLNGDTQGGLTAVGA